MSRRSYDVNRTTVRTHTHSIHFDVPVADREALVPLRGKRKGNDLEYGGVVDVYAGRS